MYSLAQRCVFIYWILFRAICSETRFSGSALVLVFRPDTYHFPLRDLDVLLTSYEAPESIPSGVGAWA